MKRSLLPVLVACLVAALLVPLQSAYKGHADDKDVQALVSAYPDLRGTAADSCATCHRAGSVSAVAGSPGARQVNHCDFCHETFVRGGKLPADTLNLFGAAYKTAGRGVEAFRALAGRDADGDGFTNEAELKQGTDPGEAASNPSSALAPRRVFTLEQLRAMSPTVRATVFQNSTKSRAGDTYSEYVGNRVDELLAAIGVLPSARSVDLLAADGYETTFTLAELRKAWPQGKPVLGLGREGLGACGWVGYAAPGLDAARELPPARILLAFEENGKPFDRGRLNPATGRLDGRGPIRVVVPQFVVSPPDLPQTADKACDATTPEASRFHEAYDHNAGKSSYAIVAIRVKPLPARTRDVNWQAEAPKLLENGQVVVFGAIASRPAAGRATTPPATPAAQTAPAMAPPARTPQAASAAVASPVAPGVLRLATTTSTADTGLLKTILPSFEKACRCRVDVVAVGTGQALEIARRGDADVVMVHARAAEDQFLAEGHARERHDVMYNDFVIVGPPSDPARIAGKRSATEAFAAIAGVGAPFASRGDKSGTETAEKRIWAQAGQAPAGKPWYRSLGQGMGETLMVAQETAGYTLVDRGTWLSMKDKLAGLTLLVGGQRIQENPDPGLRNQYGVMAVNPAAHPGVNSPAAERFVAWLLTPGTQRAIGEFGRERFGQSLFYPNPK